jgi:uncharacterized delta-60 repeat protein
LNVRLKQKNNSMNSVLCSSSLLGIICAQALLAQTAVLDTNTYRWPTELDTTFNAVTLSNFPSQLGYQTSGKIILYDGTGVRRFNSNGTPDETFHMPVLDPAPDFYTDAMLKILSDDRMLITGPFKRVNGAHRPAFARLNADGSLDTAFAPTVDFPTHYSVLLPQVDGRTVVGGEWGLRRLDDKGNIDASFDPQLNGNMVAAAAKADGKLIVATYSESARQWHLLRINPDGSVDESFNPPERYSVQSITRLLVARDGKIVVGGVLKDALSPNRSLRMFRILDDNSVDAGFDVSGLDREFDSPLNPAVPVLEFSDGKLLIAGDNLDGPFYQRINANGSLDLSFGILFGGRTFLKQPDDKLLLTVRGTNELFLSRVIGGSGRPLIVRSITRRLNREVNLSVNVVTPSVAEYIIEASSDLKHWKEIQSVSTEDGTAILDVTDQEPRATVIPRRFYRIRAPF